MRRSLLLAGSAAALLTLGVAGTAGAQVTDTTTLTVSLTGSSTLSLDAPTSATGSGSAAPGSTINVAVADTTVTDNRGSLLGWAVTATSTNLTTDGGDSGTTAGDGTGETIPSVAMTWSTGTIAKQGLSLLTGVSVGAGGPFTTPTTAVPVALSVLGSGGGTYTYPASVTVVVPPNVLAGSYTATITQTAV